MCFYVSALMICWMCFRYPEVMNEYQEAPASSPQETETPTQEVHAVS